MCDLFVWGSFLVEEPVEIKDKMSTGTKCEINHLGQMEQPCDTSHPDQTRDISHKEQIHDTSHEEHDSNNR